MEVYEFDKRKRRRLYTIANVVNKHCDDLKLAELSPINFKCLIFCQDAEIRRRVLNKQENEPNLTLQQIAEDCEKFVYVRQGSKNIEKSGMSLIKNIRHKKWIKKKNCDP